MATQLQFTRHAYDERQSSLNGSDTSSLAWETSHRHVAFAVHDAVPSPQLYQQQQQPRLARQSVDGEDQNASDSKNATAWELSMNEVNKGDIPRLAKSAPVGTMRNVPVGRSRAAAVTRKSTAKQRSSRTVPTKSVPKPGWESGATTRSNLFDMTLKKSVLFQPRPGDRLREVKHEEQVMRGSVGAPALPVRRASNAWNARIATSVPAQPKRKPRDYVKSNMEKITGQRYETLVRRSQAAAAPSRPRGSVFERLSAPVLSHTSLVRFRSPSPTRLQTQGPGLSEQRDLATPSPMKLAISSPVISTYSAPETKRSPPRGRSTSTRPSTSNRSSPSRKRVSTPPSTRRSAPSRTSSPGFRSERGIDPGREQHSMTERVFDVLDRDGRGRIGVEQIVDGLRLLHLPATRNQVADYVYLIHEGTVNTIDYEEWTILVGTLDAATASSAGGATSRSPSVRSRTSPPSTRDHYSPPQSRSSLRNSPPRSLNQVPSPLKPIYHESRPECKPYPHVPVSLTAKIPESRLTKIAKHSGDLADLILEDLLLDTVEELNKQERRQTERKWQYLQAETLESILQQIHHIEEAEANLINSGFALGYVIDDGQRMLPTIPPPHPAMEILVEDSPQSRRQGNLVLPLGVVTSANHDDVDAESNNGGPVEPPPPQRRQLELFGRGKVAGVTTDDIAPIKHRVETSAASMAILSGRLFQRIEKNRVRFMKHRQLVESSLESTGMDQASVIEMLADLLLNEIALECAIELEGGVEDLTETLAQTLL